jgi:phosphoserine phosphatase RsbX
MATVTGDLLECGVAASTMPGETIPGDGHFIKAFDGGTLVAVIDGLGHGADAGAVAAEAVRTIEQCCHDSVVHIIQACHEALRSTRGVVSDRILAEYATGADDAMVLTARYCGRRS